MVQATAFESRLPQKAPVSIRTLLTEYRDLLPVKLLQMLPPSRVVDHAVKLVDGTEPPSRQPYRMVVGELSKLQKLLNLA